MTATVAAPASAAPQAGSATTDASYRYYYGAIALNTKTMAYGYTYDRATLSNAKAGAVWQCKRYTPGTANDRYCINVTWVERGCAAVAVKYDRYGRWVRYGTASATTKYWAIKKAHNVLGAGGTKKTLTWVCTTRPR